MRGPRLPLYASLVWLLECPLTDWALTHRRRWRDSWLASPPSTAFLAAAAAVVPDPADGPTELKMKMRMCRKQRFDNDRSARTVDLPAIILQSLAAKSRVLAAILPNAAARAPNPLRQPTEDSPRPQQQHRSPSRQICFVAASRVHHSHRWRAPHRRLHLRLPLSALLRSSPPTPRTHTRYAGRRAAGSA